MDRPIIIIGAGVGGLSAAVRLAAMGHRVVVYEKNPAVGGKMSERRDAGFYWGMGPSVITMRPVLEELFETCGRRLEDYMALLPVQPLTRYFYPDGVILDASDTLRHMIDQVTRLDERDAEGYLGYLAYAARLHRVTAPLFIYGDPPTWSSLVRISPIDAWRSGAWRSLDSTVGSFVRSPHLRKMLSRFATYTGASPYRASAALNVIAHVELTNGVWYPQGGVYGIARGLARLADELGVEIHTSRLVERIVTEGREVRGVAFADGTDQSASAVVANVDVTTVYRNMLPAALVGARAEELTRRDPSCSGFILFLGVGRTFPQLRHHNILFSSDYAREFDDIFRRGIPPEEPTIYICNSCKTDPEHAPQGCENWFVLVNAPPLSSGYDWRVQAAAYRDRVLRRLASLGLDVRGHIHAEGMLTPMDLADMTGAWRGALYGTSMNGPLASFRRPHNRSQVRGLYFVGGTTHPGGGVPMVILSGRVTARMVAADLH